MPHSRKAGLNQTNICPVCWHSDQAYLLANIEVNLAGSTADIAKVSISHLAGAIDNAPAHEAMNESLKAQHPPRVPQACTRAAHWDVA